MWMNVCHRCDAAVNKDFRYNIYKVSYFHTYENLRVKVILETILDTMYTVCKFYFYEKPRVKVILKTRKKLLKIVSQT